MLGTARTSTRRLNHDPAYLTIAADRRPRGLGATVLRLLFDAALARSDNLHTGMARQSAQAEDEASPDAVAEVVGKE